MSTTKAQTTVGSTPGPWRVVTTLNAARVPEIVDPNGWIVVSMKNVWGDEDMANARLIAAAPEMRDELRETELNLTQTRLAVNIGKRPLQKRLDFVMGELERIAARHSALLARIDGTTP